MTLIYNFSVFIYQLMIRIAALAGNGKARLWVTGRKNIFNNIQSALQPNERRVWFHCASLGEFEQGRPVIEQFAKQNSVLPDKQAACKIVLTFFSPSGYEVRKNYPVADYVFYLPVDTRRNAKKFISLINPEKVFFVKYEYWFHYFDELRKRNILNFLVSAIFRPDQRFFKWYGGFFRKMLKSVSHFFVQDDQSGALLKSIGLQNYIVAGDTRFDRVVAVATNAKSFPLVEQFIHGNRILVCGSTWPADEQVIISTLRSVRDLDQKIRLIVAPHEINEKRIGQAIQIFSGFHVTRLSQANEKNISSADILLIDNIGMLSSVYRYGTFAFIGGGFGKGIHNILEAAVFGMPVFFGSNYRKFREAKDLVALGGAFPVTNSDEFKSGWIKLLNDENKLKEASMAARNYVYQRKGATEKILNFVMAK